VWPQARVIGVPVESLQPSFFTFCAVRASLATSGLRPGNMKFSTQNEVRISPVYFYMYCTMCITTVQIITVKMV
jgi:hypothetical protein